MSKIKKFFVCVVSFCVVLVIFLTAVSAYTSDENTYVEGVAYRLSEDGTYYSVVGYSDVLPTVNVVAEIDGIPVTAVSESAFQNNEYITKVTFPDSVKEIQKAALRNCVNLTTVILPSGLKSLPAECFRDCRVLKNISLPETIVSIGDFCFQNCTLLGSLKIPASVSEIGYDAFLNCESIRLDVTENPYAAAYASDFNINTSFEGTSGYFFAMVGVGTLIGAAILVVLIAVGRKYFSVHPEQMPSVWLSKIFAPVGKVIRRVFSLSAKAINFCIDRLLDIILLIVKRRKKHFQSNDSSSAESDSDGATAESVQTYGEAKYGESNEDKGAMSAGTVENEGHAERQNFTESNTENPEESHAGVSADDCKNTQITDKTPNIPD